MTDDMVNLRMLLENSPAADFLASFAAECRIVR
jgi:hypothetical protein